MNVGRSGSGRPIRVGLIGAAVDPGRSWGTRSHIPALRHLPQDYELTALCTTRPETAQEAARHFGVELAFSDARQMAEHAQVDLVVVSVRTPLHRELVAAAVAARKHVLCEWPLGVTTEEAAQTLEATRQAGVVNGIGMQGRYNEGIAYARGLIEAGHIGRPVSVTIKVTQENFGPEEKRKNTYTADVRNGATILRIATGQALEAICHCVGDLREASALISNQHDSTRVIETGEVLPKTSPDQVLIDGVLRSGAVFSFHMRGGASRATEGSRMEINGTEGDILMTSEGPANLHRARMTVRYAGRDQRSLAEMPVPERYSVAPPGLPEGPARYMAHYYADLARAIRAGEPFDLDFAHALKWQKRLDVIQNAADTGTRLQFD